MPLELPELVIEGSSSDSLCEGAAKVVCAVRKDWAKGDLLYKIYTDGITNRLVGVYHKDGTKNDQFLVRVYGDKTEKFIDRNDEKNYIQYLAPHGCGPTLYACFSNGICYSFVPGEPLNTELVASLPVYEAVAKHMAKLNSIPCAAGKTEPSLFTKIQRFQSLLPEDFKTSKKLKKVEAEGFSRSFLRSIASELESAVSALDCPLVLTHNDLLLANIIWQSEKKSVQFIDFEYTSTNYQPFDVANHFCEFAGVDTVDYNLYPSEEFQRKWLNIYLSHLPTPSTRPLDWWVGSVGVFALCAHLFWGVWALVQAENSSIDFDFAQYGITRLSELRRKKEDFLKLGQKAASVIKS